MHNNIKKIMQFVGKTPQYSYIPETDRYVFAGEEPKYKFNVIGSGINGCEHIHTTMMEGRRRVFNNC